MAGKKLYQRREIIIHFWYLDLKFSQTFKEQGLTFIADVQLFIMGFMVGGSGEVPF